MLLLYKKTKSFWVMIQLGISALFKNVRLLDLLLHYLGFRILPPGVMEFGCGARGQQDPHRPVFCPTDTSVCVCVCVSAHAGSGHHVCIPAWGRDPLSSLPAESGGQIRLRSAEPPMRERGEWGSVKAICGDSSACSALVKGGGALCTPQLLGNPKNDLSQLSIWESASGPEVFSVSDSGTDVDAYWEEQPAKRGFCNV